MESGGRFPPRLGDFVMNSGAGYFCQGLSLFVGRERCTAVAIHLEPHPLCPQVDTSSLSGDNTLMSTLEEKETDGEQGHTVSPAPADEPSSPLLSPGCTSSSSAAKLLSPRRTAPRPRLGGRGRPSRTGVLKPEAGPSAHPRTLDGLRLPSMPWNVPPDLSPR